MCFPHLRMRLWSCFGDGLAAPSHPVPGSSDLADLAGAPLPYACHQAWIPRLTQTQLLSQSPQLVEHLVLNPAVVVQGQADDKAGSCLQEPT